MGDLIFVLPILIIFFAILFKIFSIFKRAFDFFKKNFDLTIEQAGEEIKNRSSKIDASDQDEFENRIAESEFESIAKSKEKKLYQSAKSEAEKSNFQDQKQGKIKNKNSLESKTNNKNSSLGEIFSQYNELEKAVIYNEILSKPKALRKD